MATQRVRSKHTAAAAGQDINVKRIPIVTSRGCCGKRLLRRAYLCALGRRGTLSARTLYQKTKRIDCSGETLAAVVERHAVFGKNLR